MTKANEPKLELLIDRESYQTEAGIVLGDYFVQFILGREYYTIIFGADNSVRTQDISTASSCGTIITASEVLADVEIIYCSKDKEPQK